MNRHNIPSIFLWAIWIALVAFTLVVFLASLPVYYQQLQVLCQANCIPAQLTPATAQTIHSLGLSLHGYSVLRLIFAIAYALVWFAAGAVLVWRRPDEWIALLVALMLIMQGTFAITNTVSAGHSLWQFPASLLSFLSFVALYLVFSVFPSGHFVPRWTFWFTIAYTALSAGYNFLPPLNFNGNSWLYLLVNIPWIGLVISLVATQVYRYWRISTPIQRQQTKWVVFGLAVAVILGFGLSLLTLIIPPLNQPGSIYPLIFGVDFDPFFLVIPLSFGIAILRYRLWDIDVLINRALVYTLLTGILAAVYFGLVVVLQFLVRQLTAQIASSPIAIVASTLVIAALFQPLRRSIQRIIDRRFYRRKYDAARTLAAFSTTLQSELDLEQLSEQLVLVVQDTMQPAHISLWLSKTGQESKSRTE